VPLHKRLAGIIKQTCQVAPYFPGMKKNAPPSDPMPLNAGRALRRAAEMLRDLPAVACRWPCGGCEDPGFKWCSDAAASDGVYCKVHQGEAYSPEMRVPRLNLASFVRAGGRR
jgi:hypothetical protein